MHNRLLSWVVFCAFATVLPLFAQTPGAATATGGPPPPGIVRVAQVRGTAYKTVNGVRVALMANETVEQSAKITTERQSSVVLAFSNGATAQLGEDTELVLEEFLQDPFPSDVRVAQLIEEPTRSNTKLSLNKGELVGKVAKLKHDRGSTFIVNTPVGAAGIRGTTFRIVFRPQGSGLAFFELSTAEGNVNFSPGPGAGNPPGGLPVFSGQEVVIQVTVETTPSGQVIVTSPPQLMSTQPIRSEVQQQIMAQAQQIAVAVEQILFRSQLGPGGPGRTSAPDENTPPPPPPTPPTPRLTPGAL